jgi:membrane fusion protein, heavy metal efflux system
MKMKKYKYYLFGLLLLSACSRKETDVNQKVDLIPKVYEDGKKIVFPNPESMVFFEVDTIRISSLTDEIIAPAKVSATIIKSDEGSQNIILFENQDLASNYTLLVQHLITINHIQNINIKQKKIELERIKDLQQNGAATGKELLEAQTALAMEQTNLANEIAANIEHESKLVSAGFKPELLRKAAAGTAYVICDIPENEISRVKMGSKCILQFTSFPNEKFTGRIEDVADMIDPTTRMVKLRISISNSNRKLKAGMFASVAFGINEGNNISISKNSLITIQSKNFVFVKTSSNIFERREVIIGNQIVDRIIVYSGINNGDLIAIKGVMQLKGLSFGY